MNFIKIKLHALVGAALFTVAACSTDTTDNYCYQSTNTGINTVTGPEATTVDSEIVLNATFNILNGCGEFSRFVNIPGNPAVIYARVDYEGCTCTDILQTVTESYTFEASEPGEYVLKFAKPDGTFIIKTITVTEN